MINYKTMINDIFIIYLSLSQRGLDAVSIVSSFSDVMIYFVVSFSESDKTGPVENFGHIFIVLLFQDQFYTISLQLCFCLFFLLFSFFQRQRLEIGRLKSRTNSFDEICFFSLFFLLIYSLSQRVIEKVESVDNKLILLLLPLLSLFPDLFSKFFLFVAICHLLSLFSCPFEFQVKLELRK